MRITRVSYKDVEAAHKHLLPKFKSIGERFAGSSPAPFIGRVGYPFVNVGLLAPPEVSPDARRYDAPHEWASEGLGIPDVVGFRAALINSRAQASVKARDSTIIGIAQEVAMAERAVDLEIQLEKAPQFAMNTDAYMAPTGPRAALKKADITSNPRIHTRVERAFADTDLLAGDAVVDLHAHGFDENFLSRMLSVGTMGLESNRKLVPTRWSITATDDIITKNLLEEVRDAPLCDFAAHFGGYLGNYYLLLFFPASWSYELFETYVPDVQTVERSPPCPASRPLARSDVRYSTDYEGYDGRKDYAANTAGGYYACRLPIAERLSNERRQGAVLALRFITGEYTLPLGVWVCREATRKSLAAKPISFASKELMLTYARHIVRQKFGVDLDLLLARSNLLKNMGRQTRLGAFA